MKNSRNRFITMLFFLLLCSVFLVAAYLSKNLFLTEKIYFNAYSGQLSFNEINKLIKFRDSWGWLGFALIPVFYLFKFIFTTVAIYTGVFFLDLKYSFKKLFQIAMVAEVVFLVPVVLKILWFAFIQTDFTLEEFTSFYPLSLQNIFLDVQIEPWFLYPLQVVNVFEVGYWFVLAAGISMAFKEDFNKSLSLVIKSYGLGLLLWITLIVFLTLNFS